MASYAPFNSSHSSFSYSSGLEFNQYRPPVTSDNVSNSDTAVAMENQQSKINGVQDILPNANGNIIRNTDKLYGNQIHNMNGLSPTLENNARGMLNNSMLRFNVMVLLLCRLIIRVYL